MKGSVTFTVNSSNSLILGYLHFVKEGGASKQRAISVFQKLIQNLGLGIVIKMDEHLRAFLCFPAFATLACWLWQKDEFCFAEVLFQPSKRSYASKVHKLDLYLAFFTASKTSKTADRAWEMSLEKEKAQWASFFHQNFLGNERRVSRGRDSQFV